MKNYLEFILTMNYDFHINTQLHIVVQISSLP